MSIFNTLFTSFFPLGGYVDEVVDNRTNYKGYKYVQFLHDHKLTIIHFMNGEGAC